MFDDVEWSESSDAVGEVFDGMLELVTISAHFPVTVLVGLFLRKFQKVTYRISQKTCIALIYCL
jgi:cytochrome bd-type quinol oxidase subunit 1